jgi:hypothetical protein
MDGRVSQMRGWVTNAMRAGARLFLKCWVAAPSPTESRLARITAMPGTRRTKRPVNDSYIALTSTRDRSCGVYFSASTRSKRGGQAAAAGHEPDHAARVSLRERPEGLEVGLHEPGRRAGCTASRKPAQGREGDPARSTIIDGGVALGHAGMRTCVRERALPDPRRLDDCGGRPGRQATPQSYRDLLAALVARLAFVAETARRLSPTVTFIAGLTFVPKLAGRLIGEAGLAAARANRRVSRTIATRRRIESSSLTPESLTETLAWRAWSYRPG